MCVVLFVVFLGVDRGWGWGERERERERGGGFGTVDQSLTKKGLKGCQEKKEGIKEKRFDAC